MLSTLRTASVAKVEEVLERVLQTGNTNAQSAVLAAIHYTKPVLSARAVAIVKVFVASTDPTVRGQALAVAASSGDKALLEEVVRTRWDAREHRTRGETFEGWYGSSAILKAVKTGLIDTGSALDRMSLSHYGFAAQELPAPARSAIADRVDAALVRALGYSRVGGLPEMTIPTPSIADPSPPLISLGDPPPGNDIRAQMDRISETDEEFDKRQRRTGEVFDEFSNELSSADARLILSDLTLGGVKAIIEARPEIGRRWLSMLLSASDAQLRHLHHIAVQVGVTLGAAGDLQASQLIGRITALTPTIRRLDGTANIPTETIAIWMQADAPLMQSICRQRLVSRHNDGGIAIEVLAAHLCGKAAVVQQTIDELLAAGEPYDICLALMLAGYSDANPHAEGVFEKFNKTEGIIGTARKAAKEAYDRNMWAKEWCRRMLAATSPSEFWQSSILLGKVVDARFNLWSDAIGSGSVVFDAFMPSIDDTIERRIEKTQKKRAENLFGDKAPADHFLDPGGRS